MPAVLVEKVVNVATPLTAATALFANTVAPELSVIVSVEPVLPVLMVLPKVSSIVTAKVVQEEPAVAEVGGSVVKTSLFSAAGLTVVDGVEVAAVSERVLSVAVRV